MAKTSPTKDDRVPYAPRGGGGGGGASGAPLLIGVAILLLLAGWSLAEVRGTRKDLAERMGQLETKVAALQTKLDAVGRASSPQRGPDPNKVYTIKTEGAPSKGPGTAPITIAEISDFQ
jgi:hypothetical protein